MGQMEPVSAGEARGALETVELARRAMSAEVGMPRWYWWAMAAGWVVLGILGDVSAWWVASAATLVFGAAHAVLATRWLGGRRRHAGARLSAETAGPRTPFVVVGMLLVLVALTVLTALALDADGTRHAGVAAGVFVAAVVGLGGPEILTVLRRWTHA